MMARLTSGRNGTMRCIEPDHQVSCCSDPGTLHATSCSPWGSSSSCFAEPVVTHGIGPALQAAALQAGLGSSPASAAAQRELPATAGRPWEGVSSRRTSAGGA